MIYNIRRMERLPNSKNSLDQQIVKFAGRNGIATLSYKEYKWLYCALLASDIQREISGTPIKGMDGFLLLWANAARADKEIESSGKAKPIRGVPKEDFAAVAPLLEAELVAKNFEEYVSIRKKLGEALAVIVGKYTGNTNVQFWKSLEIGAMLFDTLCDFIKDMREGVAKPVSMRGLSMLANEVWHAFLVVTRELGMAKMIKYLWHPVLATIKGGFERESLREKRWELESGAKSAH